MVKTTFIFLIILFGRAIPSRTKYGKNKINCNGLLKMLILTEVDFRWYLTSLTAEEK
jgi:hypothetical protein